MPKNRGGFAKDEHHKAGHELLTAVIVMPGAGRSLVLDVRVSDQAELRPPRPIYGANPCNVIVRDGVADLTDLRRAQLQISGDRETAKLWLCREPYLDAQSAALDDLLCYFLENRATEGKDLLKQLVASIGSEVDEAVNFVNQGGQRPRFAMGAAKSGQLTRYQEDQLVTKQYTACQGLMATHTQDSHFSLATDKARVGGMDLMATYFVLGDGHVVESFPQAESPRKGPELSMTKLVTCDSVFRLCSWLRGGMLSPLVIVCGGFLSQCTVHRSRAHLPPPPPTHTHVIVCGPPFPWHTGVLRRSPRWCATTTSS